MIIIIHGIFLSSHAQNFAFLRVEPDVIIVAPRVEVGQGLLQTLTNRSMHEFMQKYLFDDAPCSSVKFCHFLAKSAAYKFSESEFYKNFKPTILNRLRVKSTSVGGKTVKVRPLQHNHKDTAVRAYVLENFLSDYECDALATAHDNHVTQTSKLNPLLCFDSVKTFKQNLKEIGLKIRVGSADFLEGTTCINESLSLLLRQHGMRWSHSTSFYPGESKFSLTLQERIKQATGLAPENGGKFQITSYPQYVGMYTLYAMTYVKHETIIFNRNYKSSFTARLSSYLIVPIGVLR